MFVQATINAMIRLSILSLVVINLNPNLNQSHAGEIDKPVIPKGKTDSCVADSKFMRLNHMDLLTHDRDKTVREGDRSIKYSLKECIACHAVEGEDGINVTASSPQHFCRVCHDYAAVSIDCFQCHASRPEQKKTAKLNDLKELHQALKLVSTKEKVE
jgi:hypothetical protein